MIMLKSFKKLSQVLSVSFILGFEQRCVCYIFYFISGRVQESIRFKAGIVGPTEGRANTEAKNQIFSRTALLKECNNRFII